MKTILLTGVTGFLGSHAFRSILQNKEFSVIAIKRKNSNTFRIKDIADKLKMYDYDGDRSVIERIFLENKIDVILHMATMYGRKYDDSISDVINANLVLPITIIENAIKNNSTCFINVDSYFNKNNMSYSALPHYSLSKKSLQNWLVNFSSKIKIINLYLEHVYGEYDSDSKFVEGIIKQIAVNKANFIDLTYGHQRRDFVYISDVTNAINIILNNFESTVSSFEHYEVGTGVAVEIKAFVDFVKHYSQSKTVLNYGVLNYRSDEIMESKADIGKILNLGFKPNFDIKAGIKKIIDLYQKSS